MTTTMSYDQYTVLSLSADSYAHTSADIGINLNGSVSFSVDAWVKFNGLCSDSSILSKEGVVGGCDIDPLVSHNSIGGR